MPSILSPDLGLLFWMFLAFLIVFALVAKYGFPVIIKMVEDRKNYIDESLKKAREANEKLANIKAESEEEARDKAREEGQKLLEEAKAQIAVEKENALRDIRNTVADVSVQIAEKVVRRQLDKDTEDEQYIERLLNEVTRQK